VWQIEIVPRPDFLVVEVLNNCVESETDASYSCSPSGVLVVSSFTYIDAGPVLTFTGLEANTITVIRIDLIIDCGMDCSCRCYKDLETGKWSTVCPSSGYARVSRISTAQNVTKKRDIQESHMHGDRDCDILDRDVYSLAMFFDDYVVDGDYHQIPLVSVDFTNNCNLLVCFDYTGCYVGEVGTPLATYKDRICNWYPISCDDGDPCTIDQCIPPFREEYNENRPANCIHIDSCGSNEISGYCYYIDRGHENWDCSYWCYSDNDCEDGGICYFIDEGFCKYGEGEEEHCYWEDDVYYYIDCSNICGVDYACGDGKTCFTTIQCSTIVMPFLLQQEKSKMDSNSIYPTTRGLSSSQLGGIIGGCLVGFIVTLMIVLVIIKKRFHQQQINTETLQIPLTEQIN
jgi:hypothetical protein